MPFVWRISTFADLTGEGGLYASGRWHTKGSRIIYAAESPAGALTEILVNVARGDLPDQLQWLKIEIPDIVALQKARLGRASMPHNWRADLNWSRKIGDDWIGSNKTLAFRVPSALVPETWNVLFNPANEWAPQMRIVDIFKLPIDQRFR